MKQVTFSKNLVSYAPESKKYISYKAYLELSPKMKECPRFNYVLKLIFKSYKELQELYKKASDYNTIDMTDDEHEIYLDRLFKVHDWIIYTKHILEKKILKDANDIYSKKLLEKYEKIYKQLSHNIVHLKISCPDI